jgi:probable rRNA maturation factor
MDGLDIVIEDARWTALKALAAPAVSTTLRHVSIDADAHELAILACDDARIAELNADFREKPTPTNVLSWPSSDLAPGDTPLPELGDIAIAFDTCAREALEQEKTFEAHVTHLLVHATLHLLGHDHQNDAEAAEMERLEVEILGKLGIADPY